jgi:cysteine desulfurase
MTKAIYLDYMATTPVDDRVIETMLQYLGRKDQFGNPASTTHQYGLEASRAVEQSRRSIGQAIKAQSKEIIWTSGATESNNLAIKGASEFYQRKGRHIISVATEHKAVLDPLSELERKGFDVTYLKPKEDGLISLQELENALRDETILVSVMHVNNEIGVIQDVKAIGQLLREKGGILFHVDAAQSLGKLAIDVNDMNIDLMSMSAHKIYGPKGIGALYVRSKPRVRLQAMMHGGGHELGYRSGTLATHQIAGFAKAVEIAEASREDEAARIRALRNKLWQGICEIDGIRLNGSLEHRVPGNLNVSFAGVDGESLMLALSELAISTTSACSSASLAPSYVLKAIGVSDVMAYSSIRLSIGRYTSEDEINRAIEVIQTELERLKELAT